jgi:putative phosphoesterase
MKIGVVSDTHTTSFSHLPDQILHALTEVDLIIHTGDFVARDVLDGLKQLGEVKAVRGNMDSE